MSNRRTIHRLSWVLSKLFEIPHWRNDLVITSFGISLQDWETQLMIFGQVAAQDFYFSIFVSSGSLHPVDAQTAFAICFWESFVPRLISTWNLLFQRRSQPELPLKPGTFSSAAVSRAFFINISLETIRPSLLSLLKNSNTALSTSADAGFLPSWSFRLVFPSITLHSKR